MRIDATSTTPRLLTVLIVACAIALALYAMRYAKFGDSANSRLATAVALIEDGTWYIDRPLDQPRNRFESGTVDKIMLDGHILSTKPPILPLVMTAEYWLLHNVFGLKLENEQDAWPVLYVMTLTITLTSYIAVLFLFTFMLAWFVDNPWHRLWPLAALVLGTQLTGFAGQINNHVPGAAVMMAALYFGVGIGAGKLIPSPRNLFLFGLFAALTFTVDMPLTVFPAFAGLYLLYRHPVPAFLWGGLGAFLPLAVHFGVMFWTTGSLVPVQTREDLYRFEGSYWRHPAGLDGLNEPKLQYLFNFTFGRHGAFLLFPVLLAGFIGTFLAARDAAQSGRKWIFGAAACLVVMTLYYVLKTNNYGGAAYGFRWYIGAMPVLLLMGAPLYRHSHRWPVRLLLALLLFVSAFTTWECLHQPWSEDQEWTVRWLFGPSYGPVQQS